MSAKIEQITQESSEKFKKWVMNYGENKYQDLICYAEEKGTTILNENLISELAKYEYNLEQLFFEIIGHIENFLRAKLCRHYIWKKEDDMEYFVKKTDGKKYKIKKNEKREIINIYNYTNYCDFKYLQRLYLRLFENIALHKNNFFAINELRNVVCHHRVLLNSELDHCTTELGENNNLINNTINIINFLPTEELQEKYLEEIETLAIKYDSRLLNGFLTLKINKKDIKCYWEEK